MERAAMPYAQSGPWQLRMQSFLKKWTGHVRWVEKVPYSLEDPKTGYKKTVRLRPALVLSFHDLNSVEARELSNDYYRAFSMGMMTWWDDGRIITRLGPSHWMAFGVPNIQPYSYNGMELPDVEYEVPFLLSETEQTNLLRYYDEARKDFDAVVGEHNDRGVTNGQTQGQLCNNLPMNPRDRHNCVTWATLAPIGANGESIMKLAGLDAKHDFHTSPTWWMRYLLGGENQGRVPFVAYFTHESLDATEVLLRTGQAPQGEFKIPRRSHQLSGW